METPQKTESLDIFLKWPQSFMNMKISLTLYRQDSLASGVTRVYEGSTWYRISHRLLLVTANKQIFY